MKRLVIAVDCDDVLVPATEACVRIYNATYGTEVRLEGAHDSSNSRWNTSRGELLRRFSELQRGDDFASIPPFDAAVQACRRLVRDHDLHLVTARHAEVVPVTVAMLDRYFPGIFTKVEHVGLDGSKGDICARLSADVLIDDNVKHLDSAGECGVSHLIWFGDYAWNRSSKPKDNVVHCLDWLSVEQEIERIAAD